MTIIKNPVKKDIGVEAPIPQTERVMEGVRDKAIAASGPNPIQGVMDIGKNLMGIAEMFGVDKKDIGKALLKSALTGKLDVAGLSAAESYKRKKIEVYVDTMIKLAWSFFGIFMVYKVFALLVTFL